MFLLPAAAVYDWRKRRADRLMDQQRRQTRSLTALIELMADMAGPETGFFPEFQYQSALFRDRYKFGR